MTPETAALAAGPWATYGIPLLVIAVLIVLNGVFVAAEFALVGSRRHRLHALAESGSGAARFLVGLFDHPTGKDRYIAVAQLGITLASIGLGMYGEKQVASWLYGPLEARGLTYAAAHTLGTVISLSFITYLHVVLGEMIPKALALGRPEGISLKVSPIMRGFGLLLRPLVLLLNTVALGLMRALRIREPDAGTLLYTSKELSLLAQESEQGGMLEHNQRMLIQNIFGLEDRSAEELMTPRPRMVSIEASASAEQVRELLAGSEHSRFPVYEESLDNILGMLHVKDFIRADVAGRQPSLRHLARPLPSVAAESSAEDLLHTFKQARVHAALVVDEYGGTLGLVTLDDLIHEVMSDPNEEEEQWVRREADGVYLINGEMPLSDLRADYALPLQSDDATTIAGLFMEHHGVLPQPGARVELEEGFELEAADLRGLRVAWVRLRDLRPAEEAGE